VQNPIIAEIEKSIRNVPDFPIKGIMFKDITTLLKNGDIFAQAVDYMYDAFRDEKIDVIAGVESRGFIFGAALAYKLNIGFVPIRKPGKLPAEKIREEYELEYGTDSLEMHTDAVQAGQNVLLVDDLLATGGTARAACKLIEKLDANIVGLAFLIELGFLSGRKALKGYHVESLITYQDE
jgi:adenine phosphoribosyltransferase